MGNQSGQLYLVVTSSYLCTASNTVVGSGWLYEGEDFLRHFSVWSGGVPRLQFLRQPLYLIPADVEPCRRGLLNLPEGTLITTVEGMFPRGVPPSLKSRDFDKV